MLAGKRKASIMVRNSIKYGQNFLVSKRLIAFLVSKANLTNRDVVYEIGTGYSLITQELGRRCKEVISYEIDLALFRHAQRKLKGTDNITLHHENFLSIPNPITYYKVFASIPFNITSRLMRKLFINGDSPEEAYLILEKGAAKRFMGVSCISLNALLIFPRFQTQILSELSRHSFHPVPKVDAVLLKVLKREQALVSDSEWKGFQRFIRTLLCGKRKCARYNLKGRIEYPEWKRLSRALDFKLNARPSELSCEQVIGLFRYILEKRRKEIYLGKPK
jgi:23S rRNA (adenine-N6)-dimethyltransferase